MVPTEPAAELTAFPEEEAVSAAYAEPSALPSALVAVRDAKVALEVGSRFPFIV